MGSCVYVNEVVHIIFYLIFDERLAIQGMVFMYKEITSVAHDKMFTLATHISRTP